MYTFMRAGMVAAGLAAALVLTGCGNGGNAGNGDDKSGAARTAPPGGAAAPGPASSSPSGPGGQAGSGFEGTWSGLTDGRTVALSVRNGRAALVADQHVCQGSVQDMGVPMLTLTCTDGNTERSMGAIESNDGTTLVISWGSKKDSLTKAAAGDLPTSIPTL
jgi:hypothetical protein